MGQSQLFNFVTHIVSATTLLCSKLTLKCRSSLNVTAFLQTAVIAIIKLIEPAFP